HDLRAIALLGLDSGWAVGDGGIVCKLTKGTWSEFTSFQDSVLVAIHFLDADHGAIAASGACYLYNGFYWTRYAAPSTVQLAACYYAAPHHLFLSGSAGQIFDLIQSNYKA